VDYFSSYVKTPIPIGGPCSCCCKGTVHHWSCTIISTRSCSISSLDESHPHLELLPTLERCNM
jgi:hypothetical protein